MTVTDVERACRQHGIAVTTFGRRVMGDPRFVLDMRNGRVPRPETAAKVRQFLASLGEA